MRIARREFLQAGLAAAAVGVCAPRRAFSQSDAALKERAHLPDEDPWLRARISGWGQLPGILASIVPPQFPDVDFNIVDYGASDAQGFNSSPAINAAIEACNRQGGGRVVVPAGIWISNGPIRLLSNVNLFLEDGASITFGTNPNDYVPLQLVRWQGVRCYNYSPLIHAYQQKNIAVTGSGTFFGQAQVWNEWTPIQKPDAKALRLMAEDGVPLSKRLFGPGHFLRPGMFEPYECQNILVQGVTFSDSPFWTMHPTFCTNVTIQEVSVTPGVYNDDGCDPDSCQNVLVEGCTFLTEDDNVSIKSGLLPDAAGLPPCENIVFQNCSLLRSAWSGLTIGSDVGSGVRNVFIENCSVANSLNAHYIKAHENWGGYVENVYFRNSMVDTCRSMLALIPDIYNEAGTAGPPSFSNINIENVTVANSIGAPLVSQGDARLAINGLNLANIAVTSKAKKFGVVSNTVGITATGLTLNGVPVSVT